MMVFAHAAQMTEELTIEYRGKSFTGRRSVSGTKTLYQTIYYHGRSKADGHSYESAEESTMRLVARTILRELVEDQLREEGKL